MALVVLFETVETVSLFEIGNQTQVVIEVIVLIANIVFGCDDSKEAIVKGYENELALW